MRNVFFSFHYKNDIFRANVVRMAWVRKGGPEPAGYRDRSMWETVRVRNEARLARSIANALHGTSVTAVLIGRETADRYWVQHEIVESWHRGNGLLGIRIHGIRDKRTYQKSDPGPSPFDGLVLADAVGYPVHLSDHVQVYDWVEDNGYMNFADWIEEAAYAAGR